MYACIFGLGKVISDGVNIDCQSGYCTSGEKDVN